MFVQAGENGWCESIGKSAATDEYRWLYKPDNIFQRPVGRKPLQGHRRVEPKSSIIVLVGCDQTVRSSYTLIQYVHMCVCLCVSTWLKLNTLFWQQKRYLVSGKLTAYLALWGSSRESEAFLPVVIRPLESMRAILGALSS